MNEPLTPSVTVPPAGGAIDYPRTSHLRGPRTAEEEQARQARLGKAAQDFESLFIHHLLKCMRATVPKSEASGFGMETMRQITDEQLAVHLARHGGIGLGKMLLQSLSHEAAPPGEGEQATTGENLRVPERMLPLRGDAPVYPLQESGQRFSPLGDSPKPKNSPGDR